MAIPVVRVKTEGTQNVIAYFKGVASKVKDVSPALRRGAQVMLRSIDLNFRSGGRPAWRPLAFSTVRWKARHGYSPLPLQRSGDLRRSIVSAVGFGPARKNQLVMGTAIPYAPYHQFGTRRLPKRPFIIFQNEDLDRIEKLVLEHITGRKVI